MARRYCTSCGADLSEDARFCGSCGKPTHQAAAVASPEADVQAPPPSVESRGFRNPVKVTRFDRMAGLIIAVVLGVPLLLAAMWYVLQFVLGFFRGFLGTL